MEWWLLFIKSITGESSPALGAALRYMLFFTTLAVQDVQWLVPQCVSSCVERGITGTQRTDGQAAIGTEVRV